MAACCFYSSDTGGGGRTATLGVKREAGAVGWGEPRKERGGGLRGCSGFSVSRFRALSLSLPISLFFPPSSTVFTGRLSELATLGEGGRSSSTVRSPLFPVISREREAKPNPFFSTGFEVNSTKVIKKKKYIMSYVKPFFKNQNRISKKLLQQCEQIVYCLIKCAK